MSTPNINFQGEIRKILMWKPLLSGAMKQKSVNQGPVVQSIVSLTISLVVKILTILVITISNSQVFLLKKFEQLLQMQKLLTFFQQKY